MLNLLTGFGKHIGYVDKLVASYYCMFIPEAIDATMVIQVLSFSQDAFGQKTVEVS